MSQSDHLLVAAIDFGTTYSGYAFSFHHDYLRDPLKISTNTSWHSNGQGLVSWKTPTSLLLNEDKSFKAFGFDAEDLYIDLADQEDHANYYYFKRFKMLLHNKLELKRDIEIPDATGKMMSAKTIFAISIRYLKDHLVSMIQRRGIEFHLNEIMWVLTIPAIWNEPAKQFMREAALEAGIENEHLTLALEPEAASIYCKTVPMERRTDDENNVALGPFSPATKYLLLDLGGGTVDVTAHEVKADGTLRELHKASGGAWGGTKVDATYFDLFRSILGDNVMELFKRESKFEHLDMERDFEVKKRNIRDDLENINIHISTALVECARDITGCSLPELIEKAGKKDEMKFRRDRITFPKQVLQNMFSDSIKSIIDHIKTISASPKVNGVDKIIMVGGFSESAIVRKAVKDAFPDIAVVAPQEPGLAVVKGAVIFGHSPNSISVRKIRYTYGVAVQGDFIEGQHPEEKRNLVNGKALCKDLFSKLVTVDQEVDKDDKVEKEYGISDPNAALMIGVFASEDENPEFVTDEGCSKIGQVVIKTPIGGWKKNTTLKIEMFFGGTEFTVIATEEKFRVQQEAKFDFLS